MSLPFQTCLAMTASTSGKGIHSGVCRSLIFAGVGHQDGNDGVSPTVTITTIPGGHRLTITDADGPKSFDVMDGGTSDFITLGVAAKHSRQRAGKGSAKRHNRHWAWRYPIRQFCICQHCCKSYPYQPGVSLHPLWGPNLQPIEAAVLTAGAAPVAPVGLPRCNWQRHDSVGVAG